jgi:uncharacterized protein (TIGR00645 family)
MTLQKQIKRGFAYVLFGSRWLMAPIYAGLIGALVLILVKFFEDLVEDLHGVQDFTPTDTILAVLGLIDLSLTANLVIMVILAGYESFVSKIDNSDHPDRPDWLAHMDFTGLKLKLVGSMVAISGIYLLEVFMNIEKYTPERVHLLIGIHFTLMLSGLIMAITDYIVGRTAKHD